jgi:predicted ATP-binding protein involved in virulence
MTENRRHSNYLKERQRLLQTKTSAHLPFALSRIEVIDFQGIKHLVIQDIPLNAQWIFLTGENGFGKTSLLRAIALGLAGDEYADQDYLTKSAIYMNGYNWNEPFHYKVKPQQVAKNQFQVATYGASRFRSNNDSIKNKKKTFSLFSDDAPLINIEDLFIKAEQAKRELKDLKKVSTFERLKQIFLQVIPQLADIRVEYFEKELLTNQYQVRYYEKGEHGTVYEPVLLNDLAAGYRSVLTMIGDMIVRLSAHPQNSLDDLQGIVLIDEIDAHLHPKYQYELPQLLSKVFPKIQFIVSTHSPIPLLSLPKSIPSVVLTVSRTSQEGITVARKDAEIEIHRLNPSALLSSPIFGFQQIFAPDTTAQEMIPTNDYEDVLFINKMKERLQTLRQEGLIQ